LVIPRKNTEKTTKKNDDSNFTNNPKKSFGIRYFNAKAKTKENITTGKIRRITFVI